MISPTKLKTNVENVMFVSLKINAICHDAKFFCHYFAFAPIDYQIKHVVMSMLII